MDLYYLIEQVYFVSDRASTFCKRFGRLKVTTTIISGKYKQMKMSQEIIF